MSTTKRVLAALAAITTLASADPILQALSVWPANKTYQEKASLYHGWTNGFVLGRKIGANAKDLRRLIEFAECMEKIEYSQAVSIIDKFYDNHPELREKPLGDMLLVAFTTMGSPCEGKSPE